MAKLPARFRDILDGVPSRSSVAVTLELLGGGLGALLCELGLTRSDLGSLPERRMVRHLAHRDAADPCSAFMGDEMVGDLA